jgi:CHASE1-domain containing sensor protein
MALRKKRWNWRRRRHKDHCHGVAGLLLLLLIALISMGCASAVFAVVKSISMRTSNGDVFKLTVIYGYLANKLCQRIADFANYY